MAQSEPVQKAADDAKPVLSEDVNAGLATPIMDLIAAGVTAVVAIWFVIASLMLPVPGGVVTAPGLLPFLTSGSLLIMAGLLAASALKRRRAMPAEADRFELPAEFYRSMLLGGFLVAYVLALQFLPVGTALRLGPVRWVIGNFEVASLVILTAILRIFWRAPLWKCAAVTFGWVVFLSATFRLIFEVRLP
jgi:hypothetical protein